MATCPICREMNKTCLPARLDRQPGSHTRQGPHHFVFRSKPIELSIAKIQLQMPAFRRGNLYSTRAMHQNMAACASGSPDTTCVFTSVTMSSPIYPLEPCSLSLVSYASYRNNALSGCLNPPLLFIHVSIHHSKP